MRPPGTAKIRLFSTTTPIQPGVLTTVDLGDTSGTFTPFILAQPEQLTKDKLHMVKNSQDTKVIDLWSLGAKKGEKISVFRERRLRTDRET